MKCYITAAFDFERKKSEYHLFWYNENRGVDEESMMYKNLSSKRMGKKEISYFKSIENLYSKNMDGDDGAIWEHKEIGFNKDSVRIFQIPIDFNQEP